MAATEGILTVTMKEAKLTRETTYIGEMSPYLTLTFNGDKYKTEVSYGGGKTPKFGDEFVVTHCNNSPIVADHHRRKTDKSIVG